MSATNLALIKAPVMEFGRILESEGHDTVAANFDFHATGPGFKFHSSPRDFRCDLYNPKLGFVTAVKRWYLCSKIPKIEMENDGDRWIDSMTMLEWKRE
ncbi:hypothetical protein KM043_004509 [Ampulex compressa]|nr:hypothetical protein KM043_004509 [Ampulex compressa]